MNRDINAPEEDETQTFKIVDVKLPSSYRGFILKYQGDLAILTLSDAIIYRNHISPACLNMNACGTKGKSLPRDNTLGLLAGFGSTEYGGPSGVLRKIKLPIVSFEQCFEMTDDFYKSFLVSDKFCAGFTNNTVELSLGDYGSGLAFKDEKTQLYNVYGIYSNSKVFENENDFYSTHYGLYTNIMDYIDMIQDKHTDSLNTLRELIEKPKMTNED